jgi:hypothetical protein
MRRIFSVDATEFGQSPKVGPMRRKATLVLTVYGTELREIAVADVGEWEGNKDSTIQPADAEIVV